MQVECTLQNKDLAWRGRDDVQELAKREAHRTLTLEVKARTSEYFSPTDAAIPETAAP